MQPILVAVPAFGAEAFYAAAAELLTSGLIGQKTAGDAVAPPHTMLRAAQGFRAALEISEAVRLARAAAGMVGVRFVNTSAASGVAWAIALDLSHGTLLEPSGPSVAAASKGLKLRALVNIPLAALAQAAPEPWALQVRRVL